MSRLLTVILMLIPLAVLAQPEKGNTLINGSIAFSFDLDDSGSSLLEFDARYLKFTGSKTSFGFSFGIITDFEDAVFNLGPSMRHYFSFGEKGGPFVDLTAGLSKYPNNTGWFASGGFGNSFAISDDIFIDVAAIYVRESINSFDLNNILLLFGFSHLLGSRGNQN